jgi:hypothetical protein
MILESVIFFALLLATTLAAAVLRRTMTLGPVGLLEADPLLMIGFDGWETAMVPESAARERRDWVGSGHLLLTLNRLSRRAAASVARLVFDRIGKAPPEPLCSRSTRDREGSKDEDRKVPLGADRKSLHSSRISPRRRVRRGDHRIVTVG